MIKSDGQITALMQDEQQRESTRTMQKINERLIALEDTSQEIQYLLQNSLEQAKKRMQEISKTLGQWNEGNDSE